MVTLSNIVLLVTATTTALIAGLFYAWSCSVTLGLARLSNKAYVAAMQSLNSAILNPFFFATFLGTAILLPISSYLHYGQPISLRFWFLLAATLLYLVGVFGVTIFGNVPLNENLKNFPLQSASMEDIARQRINFEGLWNKLNTVRTVTSFLAIVLVIMACLSPND